MFVSGACAPFRRYLFLLVLLMILMPAASYASGAPAADVTFHRYRDCDPKTRALVDDILTAIGGVDALGRVTSIRRIARIEQMTAEGTIPLSLDGFAVFPRSYHARLKSPARALRVVITSDDAYVVGRDTGIPAAALRLNDEEKVAFLQYFYCLPHVILRDRQRSDVTFASEVATEGDHKDEVLVASVSGMEIRWYFNPALRRVVKARFGSEETELDDWREVDGLLVPFIERHRRGGELAGTMRVARYEVNPSVDKSALFLPPSTWLSRTAFTFRADAPQTIGGTSTSTGSQDGYASRKPSSDSMSYKGNTFTVYDTPLGLVWVDFFSGSAFP